MQNKSARGNALGKPSNQGKALKGRDKVRCPFRALFLCIANPARRSFLACPGAALEICSWVVELRINLKYRVLSSCHYHMVTLHANSIPTTLIGAVRARRIALKMTLQEFSKIIGRNMWTVSEWENGRAVPRPSSRQRLVGWLGFDPELRCAISPIAENELIRFATAQQLPPA